MTTVHEEEAHHHVLRPFVIIQTVIQNHKCTRINRRFFIHIMFLLHLLQHCFLTFENIFDNRGIIRIMNEEFGHMCSKETVAGLCSGDDCSNRNILMMKHEILHEKTFTGITTPNENDNWTLIFIRSKTDRLHIEFGKF